jgi:hypothetical protein
MRYFFCAKIFCVLHKNVLGKIFSSSGREWPTIYEPNNLQMAPHRYRGRTTHIGTQNRRRVRVGFSTLSRPEWPSWPFSPSAWMQESSVFRIVAGDRTPSGSGSCRRGRGRGVHTVVATAKLAPLSLKFYPPPPPHFLSNNMFLVKKIRPLASHADFVSGPFLAEKTLLVGY